VGIGSGPCLVTVERFASPVGFRVALGAEQLKIERVVKASVFNLDDVVDLQAKRWAKCFQVLLLP
jgi:hypothetical protein